MTVEKVLSYALPAQITPQQLAVFDNVMSLPLTATPSRTRNHSGGSTGSYGSSGSSSCYLSERIETPAALYPELMYQLSKMQSGVVRVTAQQHQQQQQHLQQQQQQQQQQQHQQPQSRQKRTAERVPMTAGGSPGDRTNSQNQGAHKNINPTRYKTEMCRPFEENGYCKYGEKCQFAHGCHELRTLSRHPKYKTELCRTYHTVGFCPYGPRCHFIHNEDDVKLSEITQMKQQQALKQVAEQVAQQQQQQQVLSQISSQVHKQQDAISGTPVLSQHQQQQQQQVVAQVARPNTLDFASLPIPLSLGSTVDTPPSSVTNSPPSMSPTSMMSDDVMTGLPTPPPGFTSPPALSTVFNFPDVVAKPIGSRNGSGSANGGGAVSPLSVNVANLAAGLQAATINGSGCTRDDVLNECLGELFSAPLTPPTGGELFPAPLTPPTYGDERTPDSPQRGSTSSAAAAGLGGSLLRLPIFSQLAVGIN